MKLKKFSIFAISIISVILLSCIVFCFVVIPAPFKISDDPQSITVYNQSQSTLGKTLTKSNTEKENYEKILKAFVETTNLSIFERAFSGVNLYSKPTLDVDQKEPTWASVKNKNVTVELNFERRQSIIVSVGGNTRQIDFYGLAMVLDSSIFVKDVVMYYKTTSGGSYTSSPIIIGANTSKLYNLITNLNFK